MKHNSYYSIHSVSIRAARPWLSRLPLTILFNLCQSGQRGRGSADYLLLFYLICVNQGSAAVAQQITSYYSIYSVSIRAARPWLSRLSLTILFNLCQSGQRGRGSADYLLLFYLICVNQGSAAMAQQITSYYSIYSVSIRAARPWLSRLSLTILFNLCQSGQRGHGSADYLLLFYLFCVNQGSAAVAQQIISDYSIHSVSIRAARPWLSRLPLTILCIMCQSGQRGRGSADYLLLFYVLCVNQGSAAVAQQIASDYSIHSVSIRAARPWLSRLTLTILFNLCQSGQRGRGSAD